ncbi:MAG: hypothetical protein MI923_29255 [Phycisphaerales bacterium]|nr:hypothetical protein [Phycisphaerales bacterium]
MSDLAVGAARDDDGGVDINADRGAVYIFNINTVVDLQTNISSNLEVIRNMNGIAISNLNTAKLLAEHVESQLQLLISQTSDPIRQSELEEALCRIPQTIDFTQISLGRLQSNTLAIWYAELIVNEQEVNICNSTSATAAIADLNNDGIVNYDDLAMFTEAWMVQVVDPNSL